MSVNHILNPFAIPFCWLLLVVQLMTLPIEVTSSFRTRPAYEQGKGSEWVHLSSPHTTPAHLSPDFVTVCHQGFNTDRSDLLATTYLKIACKAYLQLIVRSEASSYPPETCPGINPQLGWICCGQSSLVCW
jgi:hypothetical protein